MSNKTSKQLKQELKAIRGLLRMTDNDKRKSVLRWWLDETKQELTQRLRLDMENDLRMERYG